MNYLEEFFIIIYNTVTDIDILISKKNYNTVIEYFKIHKKKQDDISDRYKMIFLTEMHPQ